MNGLMYQPVENCTNPAITRLAALVPNAVLYSLTDDGLVHFNVRDKEHNVVCDLKERTIGGEHPFPESLDDLTLVSANELTKQNVFPAASASAQLILKFCHDIYQTKRQESDFEIPEEADVLLTLKTHNYVIDTNKECHHDGGFYRIHVTKNKVAVRCTGKKCKAAGRRFERPAREKKWNLSFLFPVPKKVAKSGNKTLKRRKQEPTPDGFYPAPPPGYGYLLIPLPPSEDEGEEEKEENEEE